MNIIRVVAKLIQDNLLFLGGENVEVVVTDKFKRKGIEDAAYSACKNYSPLYGFKE